MDYFTLLLNTYINDKDIFSEVIQNRQIQLEKEKNISKKEFYFNCRKVIDNFKSKIDIDFSKRQNELCQIIDLKEAKGEPTENIEKELNTIHKNQFSINLLHLTADKFRGHFYLTDVNFIENSLNELQYISEVEKTQVRNKLLPYWLFYKVEHEVIDIAYKQMVLDFEDVQKYEVLIKQMIRISEKIFIEQIAPLDRKDFITVLNDQYNNYNLKCSDMTDWLNTTYKLITKGLPNTQINLQSKSEFLEWYKEKINNFNPEAPQQNELILIKEYKNSISNYISTILEFQNADKTPNTFYYYNRIVDFHNHIDKMLNENKNVKERFDLLLVYNAKIKNCLHCIVDLFIAYYRYNNKETFIINDINIAFYNVECSFQSIKEIEQNIAYNISTGDYDIALKIQDYCVPLLKEIRILLKDRFFIDIDKSPLKINFDEVIIKLENSINIERIKLLNDLKKDIDKEPQQPETNNTDINFEFENNFDRVKNTAVYDFFKTKLVDKKYLTVDSLHNYLKGAFENQKPPLTKFNFEKKYLIKDIRKIFYDYFTVINTEKYSTQDRYIKLLTDYFEGFDFDKIKNNFNK